MQYNKGIFWYFSKSFTKLRNLKEFCDGSFTSADNAESLWRQILYIKRTATLGFSGGREERRFPWRKFKGRKIDGITLRQKAEKCKIWLLIAASPISQILKKRKLCQRCDCRNLAMCTISQTTKNILMKLFWRYPAWLDEPQSSQSF